LLGLPSFFPPRFPILLFFFIRRLQEIRPRASLGRKRYFFSPSGGGEFMRNLVHHRLLLTVALVLLSIVSSSSTQTRQAAKQATSPATADWSQVEKLISEQKFQEAAQAAEKIRMTAQKSGNQDEWTRAFIKEVQLKTGLHGYETAVRLLKDTPWPSGTLNRTVLNLFYARTLTTYYQAYSWEINQRETVETRGSADLKAWTKDQIYAEAQKAYADVWGQRAALGKEPVSRLGEFLERNNYPEGIRSTLRDAISYLYAELLADTSLWTPQESNETYRLNLKSLLLPEQKETSLLDPAVHPLQKIAYVLSDLERWHGQNGRREAAWEAHLERIEQLGHSFSGAEDRSLLLSELERVLSGSGDLPWWAKGKAMQAEMLRSEDRVGKMIRARGGRLEGLPRLHRRETLSFDSQVHRGPRLFIFRHGGRWRKQALARDHAPKPDGPVFPRIPLRPRIAARSR
jgi:hypothetical protein